MSKFTEFLKESVTEEDLQAATELASKLDAMLKKEFPNNAVGARISKGISSPAISINLGLIKDINDLPSKIRGNDPGHTSILMFVRGNGEYELYEPYSRISVNPPEGSYLAMDSVKVPIRAFKKGTEKKVLSTFEKFAKQYKQIVKDNEDNIYGRENYSDRYFKF